MKKYKRTKKGKLLNPHLKTDRKKKIWVITVVLVMIMSIIGFMAIDFGDDEEKYNGFGMVRSQNGWKVRIDDAFVDFFSHPVEIESMIKIMSVENKTLELIDNLKNLDSFYFTTAPDDKTKEIIGMIQYEFIKIFGEKNVEVIYAFTDENEFNKPVINCEDATKEKPVLNFYTGKKFEIVQKENCIEIIGKTPRDIVKARDLILYRIYGVLQ